MADSHKPTPLALRWSFVEQFCEALEILNVRRKQRSSQANDNANIKPARAAKENLISVAEFDDVFEWRQSIEITRPP